jgi:predicted metal-dependent hydrolase
MTELPEFTIKKGNRRTVTIQIQPDGVIVVKAPRFTPDFLIRQFVRQHQDWIRKHRQQVSVVSKLGKRTYQDGEGFLYLGKQYVLKYGQYKSVDFRESYVCFPEYLKFRAKKELTEWYERQARTIITERVQANAQKMSVTYTDIYFSDTKSKWGSCSQDNRLQFNVRLIMAPLLVINYVVIHELVHTIEKNHSRAFWRKVALYTPSYRQQIKWLKDHAPEMMVAF